MSFRSSIIFTASLASLALARTDLTGCTSTDVSSPAGASVAWYVPGTGELCDFLDCGGGTAPPKTTVPGCPLYSGTATYSPSYLAGYGAMTTSAVASTSTSWASSASDSSWESSASVSNWASSASDSSWTTTGAWTETSVVSSTLTTSTTSTITSAPSILGTGTGYAGGHNTTIASATPTSIIPISTGGAMENAKAWMGGAGLLGLGAIVAAL